MEYDLRLGSTVWIEHRDTGDVCYKVKIINERQPGNIEYCKACQRGQLALMGHLMQHGILDDKVYAILNCDRCCAVTVFIYHIEHGIWQLPEQGDCDGSASGTGSPD